MSTQNRPDPSREAQGFLGKWARKICLDNDKRESEQAKNKTNKK